MGLYENAENAKMNAPVSAFSEGQQAAMNAPAEQPKARPMTDREVREWSRGYVEGVLSPDARNVWGKLRVGALEHWIKDRWTYYRGTPGEQGNVQYDNEAHRAFEEEQKARLPLDAAMKTIECVRQQLRHDGRWMQPWSVETHGHNTQPYHHMLVTIAAAVGMYPHGAKVQDNIAQTANDARLRCSNLESMYERMHAEVMGNTENIKELSVLLKHADHLASAAFKLANVTQSQLRRTLGMRVARFFTGEL